jgi:hypothetical protein
VAVVDLDVGSRDLQQCADTVIRLRAEYLWAAGRRDEIAFRFTSGHLAAFSRWGDGLRPLVLGSRVRWSRRARPDRSRGSFAAYLDAVFAYAGTLSLARDLAVVEDARDLRIGDVLVRGGSPGHASLVVDLAEEERTGRRAFLLAQGFMPAQEMHVVTNPGDRGLSPWFGAPMGERLHTPNWTFRREDLRRFVPLTGDAGEE